MTARRVSSSARTRVNQKRQDECGTQPVAKALSVVSLFGTRSVHSNGLEERTT